MDAGNPESSLITDTENSSAPMIKTEKEEVLPDSTEDVAENVQQDMSQPTNIVARGQEIKKEDDAGTSLKNEERLGE